MINNLFNIIEKGIENRIISFNENKTRITYHVKKAFTTNFQQPEEPVRTACFCDLVLNYQYPVDRIRFEIPIKPDRDRIDLLVYKDDEFKEPYIVVECKKYGINEVEFNNAIEQVFRYANYTKAWYAMAVTGNTVVSFNVKDFKSGERKTNVIGDIPINYGKPPKYKYYKKNGKDLKIVSCEELINALEKCHDTVWQGGKLAPTTAFDEVSKLLFCKLKDEKVTTKNTAYQFQIGTSETPQEVFTRIDTIYQKAKKESQEVFQEDIRLPSEIVFSCLKHLQQLAINKIDLDTKGLAFEKFMQDFFKGKMGQFFTPRNIVQFAIEMIQPNNEMHVLDPACGSGGFLLNAMAYVRAYAEQNYIDKLEIYKHCHDFAKDCLFGIEINDQIARVCKMNMILHDDGHSNIISCDSLDYIERIRASNKRFKKNHFDLILTNPPFGAKVKNSEKDYLKSYKLGNNKNKVRQSQRSDILFIERCIAFLKPGTGQMAIVLPDGILNNSSLQYVRDYILETCQILAIISLPQITFKHYGAGVKSSLLFVRKKGNNEKLENYPIFMAIAEFIGYDATGRETPDQNDLPKILKNYLTFIDIKRAARYKFTGNPDWKNKIFYINSSKLEGRMDPKYMLFNEDSGYTCRFMRIPLGNLLIKSPQSGASVVAIESRDENLPIYIKINDIDIDGNLLSYMDVKKAKKFEKKYLLKHNDILFSCCGTVGKSFYFDKFKHPKSIFSNNLIRFRFDKTKVFPKYIFYLTSLNFYKNWVLLIQQISVQSYIHSENFKTFKIPLPSKEIQSQIITLMDQTYMLKKKKENEVERLLESLNDYVLEQLGINFSNSKQETIFTLNVEAIQGKRFDPEYHQFNFKLLNQLKNPIKLNKFILDYKKGIEVGSKNYVRKGIPFVRVSDIKDLNLQRTKKKISESLFKELKEKFSPKKGELLYTKDGTIGLNYLVTKEENYIVSGAFLRIICENIELAKFLKIILSLKVYRKIANKLSSGSGIKHLNLKQFFNILIPFPDEKKINKIVKEADEINAKVKSLKTEAIQAVEKAKQEVEDILFKT